MFETVDVGPIYLGAMFDEDRLDCEEEHPQIVEGHVSLDEPSQSQIH